MYIGIDLGGTNIKVGLCDDDFNIIDAECCLTLACRAGEEIVYDITQLVVKLLNRNNLKTADIKHVGIATPGIVNSYTGTVEYASNLPFDNFPIVDVFKKYLPISKVYVANDANAAALGETLAGAAKGSNNSITVTLGTGIGGGIVLNGRIFAGGLNSAGAEIGHTVIVAGGRRCGCGRHGCWETYASATSLTETTKNKMQMLKSHNISSALFECAQKEGKISAKTAFDAWRMGDIYGQEIVEEYINYLAIGITNLINIFQPEVICIGGGVSAEKNNIIVPLIKIVNQEQCTRNNKIKTEIKVSTLGNNAGIVGAAGLGIQQ